MQNKEVILILDFGSQYTCLIKSSLQKLSFFSIIEPADIHLNSFKKKNPDIVISGIILSGGAHSVNEEAIDFDKSIFNLNIPILGICYGHQLVAKFFGGIVEKSNQEYGKEKLLIDLTKSRLFEGVRNKSVVWMSHRDSVKKLPERAKRLAHTLSLNNAAIEYPKNIFGVQFHLEVTHTEDGQVILGNFAKTICKLKKSKKWMPRDFVDENRDKYKELIGNRKVIIGLSGGVDSMTMAALLRRYLAKSKLVAIYIESGFMPSETRAEVERFCSAQDIVLLVRDLSEIFFRGMKDAFKPSDKCKIIGKIFIEEFEKIAREVGADFFAQGTIWSDVVESGVTKFSSQIKPHHNVGGLPNKIDFILIEPLRELFKDQVRRLAEYLKLPQEVVIKKVFPGPGFAIRVDGEVTREKVDLVRKCSKIIDEVLFKSKIYKKIWMAFAILVRVDSLGVKGDERVENKYAIVVRAVESKNSMTVNFSKSIYPFLEEISSRIIKETEIGRVVYDITSKPPATIEWQ